MWLICFQHDVPEIQDLQHDIPEIQGNMCDGCSRENEQTEATSYCENCTEYLCNACFKAHRKNKASSSHTLITITDKQRIVSTGICSHIRNDFKKHSVEKFSMEKINGKTGGYGTGVASLGRSHIVVIESNKKYAVIFDEVKLNILSHVEFEGQPADVTQLDNDNDFAVTIPNCIHFFHTTKQKTSIEEQRKMKVNGFCQGIDYSDDKLFVSYPWGETPKIEVMSLQGDVLRCISTDKSGNPLFQRPRYLTAYSDYIYVSDSEANAVLQLTLQGEVVNTYTDKDLTNPGGICATGDGCLLICGTLSYNIHLITTDCKKIGLALKPFEESVCWPQSVCFCFVNNVMYVVCTSEGAVGYRIQFSEINRN